MFFLPLLVSAAACGKHAETPAAKPAAPQATPRSQFGNGGDALDRPAIESAALDAAGRLGYHTPSIDTATFDPAADSWRVTVACGNREHAKTSLVLTLDARTGLVRNHRVKQSTQHDSCAAP